MLMTVLAIDCAASILSAAVSVKDEIFYAEAQPGLRQSEHVMDLIDSQMKKAGLLPRDLEGVLCMGGPGSFTGLRIGFSIAKGLALSLSIPFSPVPTLDCVAYGINNNLDKGLILAVIEARKNAYFYAFFRGQERITHDRDADPGQIAREISSYSEKVIMTGSGTNQLYLSMPEDTKQNLTADNKRKGYAREIIAIAQINKTLDNIDYKACLISGPDYNRLTDAELRKLS